MRHCLFSFAAIAACVMSAHAQKPASDKLSLKDIFELQWAADPQISPDGKRVVFERQGFDIMKDNTKSSLWIVNADGSDLRPLLDPTRQAGSPRWSPDGTKLLFVATVDGKSDIFVRWMDTGVEAKLTHLLEPPRSIAWSPDGKWLAFDMFVPDDPKPFVQLPTPPAGADWGPPAPVH